MASGIRNSAKAIIIKDGKILFTKNKTENGVFYLLPGGGQEHGETLVEALKRECLEEVSADVVVGELVFIREYIGKNHEFAELDSEVHQVEFMFKCKIISGNTLSVGHVPDDWQIGFEWLDLDKLSDYRIYPKEMLKYINSKGEFKKQVYMGSVN